MLSKFMSLEPEKRDRIINAALAEFSQRGYKNASTNEIVKQAGISKGLLFHYFSNKMSLFLFLYTYATEVFEEEFYSKLDCNEPDIIRRLRQIAILKLELIQRHPDLYNFLLTAFGEDNPEIRHELEDKNKDVFEKAYKALLENINILQFKDGLEPEKVLMIFLWVTQGLGNRELERIKLDPAYKVNYDLEKIMSEFDDYLVLLQKVFYK